MGRREEFMRYHGVYACPSWCVQDPEEDNYEHHWPEWRVLETSDGDQIMVRPRLSWWFDDEGQPDESFVEVQLVRADPQGNHETGIILTLDELATLRGMLDDAETDLESYDDQWAYDGAEADANADEPAAWDEAGNPIPAQLIE